MRRTIEVTITKTIEIELTERHLTEEWLDLIRNGLWDVEDHDELYLYAARQVAEDEDFEIEGIGKPSTNPLSELPNDGSYFHYEIVDEDCEADFVD